MSNLAPTLSLIKKISSAEQVGLSVSKKKTLWMQICWTCYWDCAFSNAVVTV